MNIGNETEHVEFKRSTSELKEGIISIASILNKHGGGILYFGVKDNGDVIGQEIGKDTLRDVSRSIASNINPGCVYEIERKSSGGEKDFIEISFRGGQAPYSAFGRYYQRFADEDRQIMDFELERLFKSRRRDNSAWENASSGESLLAVDEELLLKTLERGKAAGRLEYEGFESEDILRKLGLLAKDGCLSNAGNVLFSANRPVLLKLAIFATTTKASFLKLEHFEGNVFECIDRAVSFIVQSIDWHVVFDGSIQRKELPEIPLEAIREVVVNAFAHGTYADATAFEVDIFKDRVSIYSPGSFPRGYTPDDFAYRAAEPVALNPRIANVLFKAGDIEAFGTGFKRTFDACDDSGVKYRYADTKSGFRFEFMRGLGNSDAQEITETERAVFDNIASNPEATARTIAAAIGKTEKTVYRAIRALKERGYIEREGGDANGRWIALGIREIDS